MSPVTLNDLIEQTHEDLVAETETVTDASPTAAYREGLAAFAARLLGEDDGPRAET